MFTKVQHVLVFYMYSATYLTQLYPHTCTPHTPHTVTPSHICTPHTPHTVTPSHMCTTCTHTSHSHTLTHVPHTHLTQSHPHTCTPHTPHTVTPHTCTPHTPHTVPASPSAVQQSMITPKVQMLGDSAAYCAYIRLIQTVDK